MPAVLPETVTADELAARPRQPGAAQKDSSVAAYAATSGKWWPMFLKAASWDANDVNNFLDAEGKPRDGIFIQLFVWLYEQDVPKGVFKPMLAWAQAKLNDQRRARMLTQMPNYVCQLPGVKERKNEIWTSARVSHMEHMTDLQAAVESDIGFIGMRSMIERCLRLHVPSTSPFFSLQTLYELRATHQQACRPPHRTSQRCQPPPHAPLFTPPRAPHCVVQAARHDDLRAETFAHMFARRAARAGPRGLPMLCNVSDGGKTNNNGRISYTVLKSH